MQIPVAARPAAVTSAASLAPASPPASHQAFAESRCASSPSLAMLAMLGEKHWHGAETRQLCRRPDPCVYPEICVQTVQARARPRQGGPHERGSVPLVSLMGALAGGLYFAALPRCRSNHCIIAAWARSRSAGAAPANPCSAPLIRMNDAGTPALVKAEYIVCP
jgi:hypothetical protein